MTAKKAKTAANIDFEKSMDELEKIVDDLESGQLTLEESLTAYERGIELTKLCQKRLEAAEERVKKIMEKAGGEIDVELFEEGDTNSNG
jgi:exodeoxyribonuclease VII small subunit